MKVMLADDEMSIVKMIRLLVEKMGYDFVYAVNGKDAVDKFFVEKPDLLILDVMMPKLDGFDVCEIIRQKSNVPILFLTAKSDITDKSVGFKLGADDYMTKPFSAVELQLRINALLRRTPEKLNENDELNHFFKYKDMTIDFDALEVEISGEVVPLSKKEFALIALLARRSGQVFTKNQILDNVWGYDHMGDYNSLTVFIRRLRAKIETNPAEPEYLQTVWGVGYKFPKPE